MIKKIYLSWKSSAEAERFIIAELERMQNGISFRYLNEFHEAQKQGLSYFYGFKNADTFTPEETAELLSHRIISPDRPDRVEFLKFWEASDRTDLFELLAYTQGLSPTDSFEFLADFSDVPLGKLCFVTNLEGSAILKIKSGTLKTGDVLRYERQSKRREERISIFSKNIPIGTIKTIHSKVFASRERLLITVKAVEENGYVKKVFIKIEDK